MGKRAEENPGSPAPLPPSSSPRGIMRWEGHGRCSGSQSGAGFKGQDLPWALLRPPSLPLPHQASSPLRASLLPQPPHSPSLRALPFLCPQAPLSCISKVPAPRRVCPFPRGRPRVDRCPRAPTCLKRLPVYPLLPQRLHTNTTQINSPHSSSRRGTQSLRATSRCGDGRGWQTDVLVRLAQVAGLH